MAPGPLPLSVLQGMEICAGPGDKTRLLYIDYNAILEPDPQNFLFFYLEGLGTACNLE